jgi:hypothetical protein
MVFATQFARTTLPRREALLPITGRVAAAAVENVASRVEFVGHRQVDAELPGNVTMTEQANIAPKELMREAPRSVSESNEKINEFPAGENATLCSTGIFGATRKLWIMKDSVAEP